MEERPLPLAQVRDMARDLGLDLVGCAPAKPLEEPARIALERVRQGLMGDLPWYTPERVLRGADPQALLPGARSLLSVALNYYQPDPEPPGPGLWGRVARYAWGRDYHNLLKKRLHRFARALEGLAGRPHRYRIYVDDGPMQDRAVAQRAGVGWFGKNTMLLTPLGSWTFLGQVLTDLWVEPSPPLRKTCGACTRCLPACPTGALPSPYVLDARRCIAYLTIEHRGPIPRDLRPLLGNWVFGCDLCQEVCPVNRRAPTTRVPDFAPRNAYLDLAEVLALDEEGFRARFQGSPIRRARLEGLKRNACVVLGNLGNPQAVPLLTRALQDPSPLVRGHAGWALGRIATPEAVRALRSALPRETDPWVREELAHALRSAYPTHPLEVRP